jgi:hypothetical protein
MSVPERLIVSYDDGSSKEIDFGRLGNEMEYELARLGLCPPPPGLGSRKHYFLLQWKDGWQEVIGSDRDVAELLRYFVIRRIEDRGRLSFEVGADHPELFIIRRTPMDLKRLLIVGDGSVKSYSLTSEVERWEGIFDGGGKLEYVKYDKTEDQFPGEMSDAPESLDETMDSIKDELDKRGLSPQEVLGMDQSRRIEEYKEIAQGTGIRGHQRQADVYGFIELLVRRLGTS